MKTTTQFLIRCSLTAVVALGLLSVGAKADAAEPSLRVGLHTVSTHSMKNYRDTDRSIKEFNNVNPGIYASYGDKYRINVGTYKNSYNKQTTYVAGSVEYSLIGPVSVGGFLGLGTGYTKHLPKFHAFGSLNLLGGATISVALTDKITARMLFVPGEVFVNHLTVEYQF